MGMSEDEFKALFDLPKKTEEKEADDIYETSDAKASFEEKLETVESILAEESTDGLKTLYKPSDEKPEVKIDTTKIPDKESAKKIENIKQSILDSLSSGKKQEEKKDEFISGFDDLDEFVEEEKPAIKQVVKEEKKVEVLKEEEEITPEEIEELIPELKEKPFILDKKPISTNNSKYKLNWVLKSPEAKWDTFYEKKADLLDSMLDEELPLDQWKKDLISAKVDISSTSYSLNEITERMQQVQNWRERIKEIQIRVTDQYFLWNRMHPLMRGLLAATEYAKPVEKHGSLIYEHMRDIESYYAKLESLHYAAEMVSKTLDKASDTLSRMVTILMPHKIVDRASITYDNSQNSKDSNQSGKTSEYTIKHEEKEQNKDSFEDEELKDFDEIKEGISDEKKNNTLEIVGKPSIKKNWNVKF